MSRQDIEPSLPDKREDFPEWYTQILEKAEIVDIRCGVKGAIVYRPTAMDILDKVIAMFENELRSKGHKKVLFPIFIPEDNLKKESEHFRGFEGEVFWITHAGHRPLEKRLALRPTSETVMYPMYSLWIKSHKDLPLKLFQTVAVYRYETKATRPLFRGREFLWIEAHNAFKNEEDARKQVEEDGQIFRRVVYDLLGIPLIHVKREDFDKFAGAVDTYAFETMLPDGRLLQIGTTHYLGTNFSRVFNVKYLDVDGENKLVHQTCYGIGLSRILASVICVHGDEFGLILPFSIAPIQIVIIPIPKKDADVEKITRFCMSIKEELEREGYRVLADLSDKTPGEKFYRYDMLGVPLRLEVGPREVKRQEVTMFRRDKRERFTVERSKLIDAVKRMEEDILNYLRDKAEREMRSRIVETKTKEEFLEVTSRGNFIIKAGFCGRAECAEDIKAETGYEVRGESLGEGGGVKAEKCIWCGAERAKVVYIAKAY